MRLTQQTDFNQADVEAYMQEVVGDHADPLTGEVNVTALAEDAAHEWQRDDWLDDPDHPIFDLAVDVAEIHETAIAAFVGQEEPDPFIMALAGIAIVGPTTGSGGAITQGLVIVLIVLLIVVGAVLLRRR
jgi:hypothetical protein